MRIEATGMTNVESKRTTKFAGEVSFRKTIPLWGLVTFDVSILGTIIRTSFKLYICWLADSVSVLEREICGDPGN